VALNCDELAKYVEKLLREDRPLRTMLLTSKSQDRIVVEAIFRKVIFGNPFIFGCFFVLCTDQSRCSFQIWTMKARIQTMNMINERIARSGTVSSVGEVPDI